MRFRKSIKLAPGVRMNFSGSGVSWTLGPRGASIGVGKRGARLNYGIPGTGIGGSHQLTAGRSARPVSAARREAVTVAASVAVQEDGTVTFKDESGQPLNDALMRAAKTQHGDAIREMLDGACERINEQVEGLAALHLDTPPPWGRPDEPVPVFDEPAPVMGELKRPGFLARILKRRAAAIEAENDQIRIAHRAAMEAWQAAKANFEQEQIRRRDLRALVEAGRPPAMELYLEEVLQDIVWPRETLVSLQVQDGGARLYFDVDLPEVEDMPTKTASVQQRGFKLSIKELSSTKIRQLYAQHIHSIAFRLIGEAFAALPTVQEVCLSGYSQRRNAATGHEEDQYLLAVRVSREAWRSISFANLDALSLFDSLERFELRRQMSKGGVFKEVQPFSTPEANV